MSAVGFRLHHLGFLTDDLAAAAVHWAGTYGAEPDGPVIHDAEQQARVRLLQMPGAAHWIELISPDSPSSHLHKALSRKVTLHHHAYAVKDWDGALAHLRTSGCVPLGRPVTGAAFGRNIMWWHDPRAGLVELIATGPGPYSLSEPS